MMQYRWAAAAAAGVLAALALTGTAHAHHNAPTVELSEPGECGTVELTTAWPLEEHQVDDHRQPYLVVLAAGELTTAEIGEAVELGPFELDELTIQYRIWGGGERDYDSPELANLDELVEWLEADDSRSPTDADAPGVAWHELTVQGCVPESEPTTAPSSSPSAAPSSSASSAPTTAAPGAGGELPKTSGVSTLPALGIVGTLLLALGSVAVWVSRRRLAPLD